MANEFQSGKVEALRIWGSVCSGIGDCSDCPIGQLTGVNLSCQEFATQFPEKFLSVLEEIYEGGRTYYHEYCTRFPNSNLSLEELATCACRKCIFEGDLSCDSNTLERCVACWSAPYKGDIEVTDTEESSEQIDYSSTLEIIGG